MGEQEASPSPDRDIKSKEPSICEECGSNPWKYRCPGCSLRTCALPCVTSHKRRTGCTGKRSRTDFVPLAQFDDNLLLSDYKLLEETKRAAESARRMLGEFRGGFGYKLPTRLRMLRNAAYRRRTRLLVLSPGMTKREANRSRYDQRKNSIFWTIEWRFHSTDVILIDHGVDEHVNLSSVIEKHLTPGPWNHQLKPFCDVNLNDLKFFVRKNPKGPKSPFRELDIKASLGRQLMNVVIVEYPVVYVFLPSHRYDFEVEKDQKSFPKDGEHQGSFCSTPSSKGVQFREEEIEEGEVSEETQILDLMDYQSSRPCDNAIAPKDKLVLKSVEEDVNPKSSNKSLTYLVAEDDRRSLGNVSAVELSEDGIFDFEQELKDAFSDIVGEINPDDFLCLDGAYSDAEGGGNLLVHDGNFLAEDELEEGEIPSY